MKNIKKLICLTLSFALAASVFTGCGKSSAEKEAAKANAQGDEAEAEVEETSQSLTKFFPEEMMEKHLATLNDLEDGPLSVWVGLDEYPFELFGHDHIVTLWNMADEIIAEKEVTEDVEITSNDVYYDFCWDGGDMISFEFTSGKYFYYEDAYYAIENPDAIKALADKAIELRDLERKGIMEDASSEAAPDENVDPDDPNRIPDETAEDPNNTPEEAAPAGGETPIEITNNSFDWDEDGDGVAEHFTIEYYDNGADIPNDIAIISPDGHSCIINSAYSVEKIFIRDGQLIIQYHKSSEGSPDDLAEAFYE